jgi:hypothetical protein
MVLRPFGGDAGGVYPAWLPFIRVTLFMLLG